MISLQVMDLTYILKRYKKQIVASRRLYLQEHAQLIGNDLETVSKSEFGAQISSNLIHLMEKYDSPEWQSQALDVVTQSPVYERLDKIEEENPEINYTDELVKELLKWFKDEFFTWVNKLPCTQCGNQDQGSIHSLGATKSYTKDHFDGNANVIERYRCGKCQNQYEFPRYNNPVTLLKTRQGRCGEWNNCFILMLVSLGLDVRYIWNAEDHVWCEYFSSHLKRWIHLDCCENSFDNPLLYNDGWGKKMSYTFGIHKHYILDVSQKYLDPSKPERHIPRNKITEKELRTFLLFLNANRLSSIKDDSEFLQVTSRLICDYHFSNIKIATATAKIPRQSGSDEWTSKRGENGS